MKKIQATVTKYMKVATSWYAYFGRRAGSKKRISLKAEKKMVILLCWLDNRKAPPSFYFRQEFQHEQVVLERIFIRYLELGHSYFQVSKKCFVYFRLPFFFYRFISMIYIFFTIAPAVP